MKRQVNDGKWVWCARGSKTDRVILSVNLRFFHLGSRAFAWIIEYKYVQLSPSKPLYAICCPSLSRRKPVARSLSAFILCVAKMYLFCFIFFNLLYSILDVFYFLSSFRLKNRSTMRKIRIFYCIYIRFKNAGPERLYNQKYPRFGWSSTISLIMYTHWDVCSSQHINHILFNWAQLSACRKRGDVPKASYCCEPGYLIQRIRQ